MATRIAEQIAARLLPPAAPAAAHELVLAPPELGRVTIRFEGEASGGTLFVLAERAETLDLMRRNLDTLEQALRAVGHPGCQVHLGGRGTGGGHQAATPARDDPGPQGPAPVPDARPSPRAAAAGRLDLRI